MAREPGLSTQAVVEGSGSTPPSAAITPSRRRGVTTAVTPGTAALLAAAKLPGMTSRKRKHLAQLVTAVAEQSESGSPNGVPDNTKISRAAASRASILSFCTPPAAKKLTNGRSVDACHLAIVREFVRSAGHVIDYVARDAAQRDGDTDSESDDDADGRAETLDGFILCCGKACGNMDEAGQEEVVRVLKQVINGQWIFNVNNLKSTLKWTALQQGVACGQVLLSWGAVEDVTLPAALVHQVVIGLKLAP